MPILVHEITNIILGILISFEKSLDDLKLLVQMEKLAKVEVMENTLNEHQQAGAAGEELINNFIDTELSRIFTFPSPRTKEGAQVADILIWMNRLVILIEVKTRTEGTAPIQNWVRNRIQEGVEQIVGNYERIQRNEEINLHNEYYHLRLDCTEISEVVGMIVLVHEEECSLNPSEIEPDIYKKNIPIHVFSWNDLRHITKEINTISDLRYYLRDRYAFISNNDILLGSELEALGYYKSHEYKFPDDAVDFHNTSYWDDYKTTMAEQIEARDIENLASRWIDSLEHAFTKPRRLHNGIPLGIYFAWEVGSIQRRARAILGKKLEAVQDWFLQGKTSRRFAYINQETGNWHIYFYLRGNVRQVHKELERLVRLKLIIEVHENNFGYAVYGFGFRVSIIDPPQLMGIASAIIIANEKIRAGKYTDEELEEARRYWGSRQEIKVKEFPDQ